MAAVRVRNKKYSTILTVLLLAVVFYFAATFISIQTKARERERSVEQLSERYQELLAENENLNDIINSEDDNDYMERIAREQYGYAMPDERVYYDSSDS